MNGKQYLKNQIPAILLNLMGMLALALFLMANGNPIPTVLFIGMVWLIVLILYLFSVYYARQRHLHKLLEMTKQLVK